MYRGTHLFFERNSEGRYVAKRREHDQPVDSFTTQKEAVAYAKTASIRRVILTPNACGILHPAAPINGIWLAADRQAGRIC